MKRIAPLGAVSAAFLIFAPQITFAQAPQSAQAKPASDPFHSAKVMTGDDLRTVRAGQDVTVNAAVSDQTLAAENHDNTVTAATVNNGAISFSPGSLQGFSGLGNFVINTGNNNNLQGSLSVTVLMTPPAVR